MQLQLLERVGLQPDTQYEPAYISNSPAVPRLPLGIFLLSDSGLELHPAPLPSGIIPFAG